MYEPRGYVYEVGFFAHCSNQRCPPAIVPAQWHVGAPPRRSARQGPLSSSAGSRFFARSGRKTAPAPPAVCALSAAAARLLRPEQRAATAWRAPDACQLSAAADLGRRKNVIFRLASSCCSGDLSLEPPRPVPMPAVSHIAAAAVRAAASKKYV